jgi:hypothetical protein
MYLSSQILVKMSRYFDLGCYFYYLYSVYLLFFKSMKLEQQQRMDAVTSQGQERSKFSGPRFVRGGQHGSITATPNSPPSPSSAVLRGGGGGSMSGGVATAQVVSVPESLTGSSMSKTTKQDSVSSAVSSSSSGLLSFFKGQSTKNL